MENKFLLWLDDDNESISPNPSYHHSSGNNQNEVLNLECNSRNDDAKQSSQERKTNYEDLFGVPPTKRFLNKEVRVQTVDWASILIMIIRNRILWWILASQAHIWRFPAKMVERWMASWLSVWKSMAFSIMEYYSLKLINNKLWNILKKYSILSCPKHKDLDLNEWFPPTYSEWMLNNS